MVAFAEPSRPTRRAPARPCEGSSSCAPGKTPTLRTDRNGQYSITALTDGSGTIVERYAYTAYGQPTFADASGTTLAASAETSRYTYTGREWDEELHLYHYRARMYDAVAGRFCSRDPIGYEGSQWNLLEYCSSGPLNCMDFAGLLRVRPTVLPGGYLACDQIGATANYTSLSETVFNCTEPTTTEIIILETEVAIDLGVEVGSVSIGASTGITEGQQSSIDLDCCEAAAYRYDFTCECKLEPWGGWVFLFPAEYYPGTMHCNITSRGWIPMDAGEHCANCN